MAVNRPGEVISIDLRSGALPPATFEELSLVNAELSTVKGIVKPWNILVICSAKDLNGYVAFFQMLMISKARPRVILLLVEIPITIDGIEERLILPEILRDRKDTLRIFAVTSQTGCLWSTDLQVPSGIAQWDSDPLGEESFKALVGPLHSVEVFDGLFERTRGTHHDVWSIGTKQAWFGQLPTIAIAGALSNTGEGFVGEDGKLALLPKSEKWEIPIELCGGAIEDDILSGPNGSLAASYEDLKHKHKKSVTAFGLLGNKGLLDRIIGFPEKQKKSLEALVVGLKSIDNDVLSMLDEVDANNGFDVQEHKDLAKYGVVLQREDSKRKVFESSDSDLLTRIAATIHRSNTEGHSFAPLILDIESNIATIMPRTQEVIIDEFRTKSFESEIVTLESAVNKVPKSPFLRIASIVAGVIKPMWSRTLIVLLLIWIESVAIFEAIDNGNTEGFIPMPQVVRAGIAKMDVLISILIFALVVASGWMIYAADSRIRKWGKSSTVETIGNRLSEHKSAVAKVAMNDWVLSFPRRRAVTSLEFLHEFMVKLSESIRHNFIDSYEALSTSGRVSLMTNPAVRIDLNNVAAAGAFRQLDEVVDILRSDISHAINYVLEFRIHEFRGRAGSDVPTSMAHDVEQIFSTYANDVIKVGPLNLLLSRSDDSLHKRKDLITSYWNDVALVARAAESCVLIGPSSDIVQFVSPDDLLQLDQQDDKATFIRFAPEPSREHMLRKSNEKGISDLDLIFTESTESAGTIRLVGFRGGFYKFESDPLANQV